MASYVTGLIGFVLCISISHLEGFIYAVGSNIILLYSILLTLKAEGSHWIRHKLHLGGAGTWILMLTLYFGSLLLWFPGLRDLKRLVVLALPLLLSGTLMLPVFGWIQDRIVRRAQRRLVR